MQRACGGIESTCACHMQRVTYNAAQRGPLARRGCQQCSSFLSWQPSNNKIGTHICAKTICAAKQQIQGSM